MQRASTHFGGHSVPARQQKLVVRLRPHPAFGGSPADVLRRQRHVRRHPRLAVQQARQRSALAAEPPRRLGPAPTPRPRA